MKVHYKETRKKWIHLNKILNLFSLSGYVSKLSSNNSYLHWRLGIHLIRVSIRNGVLYTKILAAVVVRTSGGYNLYSHGRCGIPRYQDTESTSTQCIIVGKS
jgi:hypothetical protein